MRRVQEAAQSLSKQIDPKTVAIVSTTTAAVCFTTCVLGNMVAMATGDNTSNCAADTFQHAVPGVVAFSLLTAAADPQKALDTARRFGTSAKNAVQQVGEYPAVKSTLNRVGALFQQKKEATAVLVSASEAHVDAEVDGASKPKQKAQ
ncbi:MAG: hypothetical protein A3F13_09835 [Gammaproteobacteria bacterium RIFCSPHIGHO2_12_FULL_40_19]|nr:MAG: hypothetical protein A3F13_09835 [Gammaproteobacteria bacterium RIFCSPHIGHO2_12_FULL_40_19]